MVTTSTVISIGYFSINVIFLIILAIYVYKTGEHSSTKSKSYLKDVWNQRKIFAPILVHFYDTATDIGVVYYWFTLMKDEQTYGSDYYKSVNMTIFFWCGIAFLILYRFSTLLVTICYGCCCPNWSKTIKFNWYDPILVIFDIYIFKAVYESFRTAQKTITKNKETRKQNQQQNIGINLDLEITQARNTKDNETPKQKQIQIKEDEVEPHVLQRLLQLYESILESMPQIMIQSIFVIRSANDDKLKEESNIILIFFSLIASLVSISNKFIIIDKKHVQIKAQSAKPSLNKCPKNCVNYWYIIRVIWRICHIMSKFTIYVLIWVVLGGAWLPIWCIIIFILCSILSYMRGSKNIRDSIIFSFVSLIGCIIHKDEYYRHIIKYLIDCIGIILIAIFGTLHFDCRVCASPMRRKFVNDQHNDRILIFFIMGCITLCIEVVLYSMMKMNNIIKRR